MKAIITAFTLLIGLSLTSCQHGHKNHKDHSGHHKGHDKHHDKNKKWEMMDTNKDGAVSKEEFQNAHLEKFKKMDANGDGKVTMEEKKAYKEAKKAAMKDGEKACCS